MAVQVAYRLSPRKFVAAQAKVHQSSQRQSNLALGIPRLTAKFLGVVSVVWQIMKSIPAWESNLGLMQKVRHEKATSVPTGMRALP